MQFRVNAENKNSRPMNHTSTQSSPTCNNSSKRLLLSQNFELLHQGNFLPGVDLVACKKFGAGYEHGIAN